MQADLLRRSLRGCRRSLRGCHEFRDEHYTALSFVWMQDRFKFLKAFHRYGRSTLDMLAAGVAKGKPTEASSSTRMHLSFCNLPAHISPDRFLRKKSLRVVRYHVRKASSTAFPQGTVSSRLQ